MYKEMKLIVEILKRIENPAWYNAPNRSFDLARVDDALRILLDNGYVGGRTFDIPRYADQPLNDKHDQRVRQRFWGGFDLTESGREAIDEFRRNDPHRLGKRLKPSDFARGDRYFCEGKCDHAEWFTDGALGFIFRGRWHWLTPALLEAIEKTTSTMPGILADAMKKAGKQ